MHPSIPLLVISLIYTILVLFLFFSKEKIKTIENKLYAGLLFTVIIGVIIDIIGIYCHLYLPDTSFFRWFVVKIYLVYLLTFVYLITVYIVVISFKEEMKLVNNTYKSKKTSNIIKFITAIYAISIVLNFILTFTYYKDGNAVYLEGSNTFFVYGMSALGILSWVIMVLINRKSIPIRKIIPIIIFVIICVPVILLQLSNPELLVVTSLTAFLVNFMYHTIENPDMQIINELYKNKELVEQTYEDKSNFLFELTQEVRDPLFNISKICNEIQMENNVDKIKENIKVINNSIRQLDFIVNDVLNVNSLDVQKVKFVNNRYNLNSLFNDIVTRIKPNINETVEFRTSIPNNIPYLSGDSIKLKQILYSLIMNSIKKTENGFIEFNVNVIEKYDICRVIFTIIDSGTGMSLDKINEILSITGEFNQDDIKDLEKTELNIKLCQKIIKALGGNLLIKSKLGKGTEVMLTVDQRIFNTEEKNNILNNYEKSMYTNKKVLVICQTKEITDIIKEKLKENNISVSHILSGKDAIDKIKSGKKYNYIIIEDEMKVINGFTTLKEMEKLKGFDMPVIVLIKENKENIKEHFINDGFEDYILLRKLNEELERIIEKY
ncbi:MAG: response regulator [Bacilli bacterium]|nr:response regulator [Bacilli bacterium]